MENKKDHPNKAFYDAIANTPIYYGFDFGTGENILVLNKLPKPKRPRGKKVYSTDKGVKR